MYEIKKINFFYKIKVIYGNKMFMRIFAKIKLVYEIN